MHRHRFRPYLRPASNRPGSRIASSIWSRRCFSPRHPFTLSRQLVIRKSKYQVGRGSAETISFAGQPRGKPDLFPYFTGKVSKFTLQLRPEEDSPPDRVSVARGQRATKSSMLHRGKYRATLARKAQQSAVVIYPSWSAHKRSQSSHNLVRNPQIAFRREPADARRNLYSRESLRR